MKIRLSISKTVLVLVSTFVLSACGLKPYISNSILDRIGPEAVSTLQWVDTNLNAFSDQYTLQTTLVASWTPSDSPELARQEVQLYIGAQCGVKSGSAKQISSITQKSYSFTGLVDGAYSFKVLAYDPKGNVTASACSNGMFIDRKAPVVTVSTNGVTWINSTTQSAFAVSGTCMDSGSGITANVTVKLSQGANNWVSASTSCAGGSFSTQLNLIQPTSGSFTDGTNLSVVATVADRMGTVGTSDAQSVSYDKIAPALQLTTAAIDKWINSANQSSYNVSGTCADVTSGIGGDITIGLTDGTNQVTKTTACLAGGTFSASIDASSLLDGVGNISIAASVSDVAGNTKTTGTITRSKDTVAPVLALVSPLNQSFVKGNANVTVSFSLTEMNADTTQSVAVTYFNGTTTVNSTVAMTNGPLTNASFTKAIATPNSSNTSISVTLNYTDLAGNPAISVIANYKTDLGTPTVTSLSLNNGATTTENNSIKVSLTATNTISPVTQFCLKYNNTTAPSASDACWVNVNAPIPNITPSTSISFSNYYFQVGFVKATYLVYAWVKNEAGTVSALSDSLAGSLNIDKFSIDYDPGTPPEITKLVVANTDTPSNPVANAELQATSGSDIYVKWYAKDQEELAVNPISIYYTTDNVTYTPFSGASALLNAPGSCTIDTTFTGCMRLTSPTNSYFKVRVVAKDTRSTTVFYNSEPLNNPKLKILAGNTESGLGGSAKTAVFSALGISSSYSYAYQNRLAVSSDGKYFYIDPALGLVWINPATGILNKLIPITGTSSADNTNGSSNVSSATLKSPLGIAMDYQDHLLIYDFDRIRKVDLSTMKISTIIGLGSTELSTMTSTVNALNAVKLSTSSTLQSITMTMIPMPNGDLLFSSPDSNLSILRDWKYVAENKTIEPMSYADSNSDGMGNNTNFSWNTGGGSTVYKTGFAVEFDPSTSAVTALIKGFYKTFVGDSYTLYARINFAIGNANSGYPSTGLNNLGVLDSQGVSTGMNGKIYSVGRFRTLLQKHDVITPSSQNILGTGVAPTAICAENTLATSCPVDIESYFVSSTGRVYFMDQGFIRTINESNQVITLFGQYPSYNGTGSVPVANARFGRIRDLKLDRSAASNKNRMVVLDTYSRSYREVIRNGDVTQLINSDSQWHGPTKFELDPANGDIISPYGGVYIRRFSKNPTPASTNVVGGNTDKVHNNFTIADGKKGNEVFFDWYNGGVVGLINNMFYYFKWQWDGNNSVNCMVKKYDTGNNNYTQSHFLGNSTCNDEWQDGASTSSSGTSISTNISRVEYDQVESRHLILRGGGTIVWENGKWVEKGSTMYYVDSSNILHKFPNLLTYPTYSFTHVHESSSVLQIYYCAGGYQIFKYTPSTNVTVELPLGPPGMVCTSEATLNYISDTNSIVFGYAENGLYGVAEYFL